MNMGFSDHTFYEYIKDFGGSLLALILMIYTLRSECRIYKENKIKFIKMLHDELYSEYFYLVVKGQVHNVIGKLKRLKKERKFEELDNYQNAIVSGWTDDWIDLIDMKPDGEDWECCHDKRVKYYEPHSITEHQAITMFIRKWCLIANLYESGVFKGIFCERDERIFSSIRDTYYYDRNKLEIIVKIFEEKMKDNPPFFVKRIRDLFKQFDNHEKRSTTLDFIFKYKKIIALALIIEVILIVCLHLFMLS